MGAIRRFVMVRSYLGRGHDAARQRSSEYCLTEKPVTDNAPIRAAHPREHASSLMPCPVEHAAAFHTGGRRHIAMSKNLSASAGRKLTYASATEFAVDAARAFAGALIFALPMLMTMEMWWLGFTSIRSGSPCSLCSCFRCWSAFRNIVAFAGHG